MLGTPEGLKKFVSIQESPYHGLNLCIGTVAEMLDKPGKDLLVSGKIAAEKLAELMKIEAVRYVAKRP